MRPKSKVKVIDLRQRAATRVRLDSWDISNTGRRYSDAQYESVLSQLPTHANITRLARKLKRKHGAIRAIFILAYASKAKIERHGEKWINDDNIRRIRRIARELGIISFPDK